jgi:hypothetical protein
MNADAAIKAHRAPQGARREDKDVEFRANG